MVKTELLKTLDSAQGKDIIHKICNLIVEVQGTMYDDEVIWQELMQQLFNFVNSEVDYKVEAALKIFNGLFSYIIDHLVKYKNDLMTIFNKTLEYKSLEINIASLQAISNFLQIAERKDLKEFYDMSIKMASVPIKAMQEDDEVALEDAMIEFNEVAEIEP